MADLSPNEQAFAKVDLMTAELEMTASIYDGFSTAIVVKGQPRTVGLFREFDDAVQVMALIEQARITAIASQVSDKATEHRQGNGLRASVGDQPAQAHSEPEPNGRPSPKTDQNGGGSPESGRRGAILAGGAQLGERTVGTGQVEELSEGAAATPAARAEAQDEGAAGWIVGNSEDNRWRSWDQGSPVWVDDRARATRYARREDAEAVHAEDEDAWCVKPYPSPTPAADDDRVRIAELEAAVRNARRQLNDMQGDCVFYNLGSVLPEVVAEREGEALAALKSEGK